MKAYHIIVFAPVEEEVFTGIKKDADAFVFDCMFKRNVEFYYRKFDMDEPEFEDELARRHNTFEYDLAKKLH